jgi:hypothetical protein
MEEKQRQMVALLSAQIKDLHATRQTLFWRGCFLFFITLVLCLAASIGAGEALRLLCFLAIGLNSVVFCWFFTEKTVTLQGVKPSIAEDAYLLGCTDSEFCDWVVKELARQHGLIVGAYTELRACYTPLFYVACAGFCAVLWRVFSL